MSWFENIQIELDFMAALQLRVEPSLKLAEKVRNYKLIIMRIFNNNAGLKDAENVNTGTKFCDQTNLQLGEKSLNIFFSSSSSGTTAEGVFRFNAIKLNAKFIASHALPKG